MKILVCNWRDTTHPRRGGAEVYTHMALTRLVDAGHQVTLFSSNVEGRPSWEFIDGVEHIRGGGRFSVYKAAESWYRREGRHAGFDVVIDEVNTRPFFCHTWVDPDTTVVALIHQLAREVWSAELPAPLAVVGRYFCEPRWLHAMRYVPTLTVSESSRQSLLDAGIQRVSVLPEGIEQSDVSGVDRQKASKPTAVFCGRLSANKRPHHAVEAVRLARRLIPDLQLRVIGDGPMRSEIEKFDDIEVMGRVSQELKFETMASAHVLLVPSVREGWGLVVDEAATVGTRTIGYDVPGLRDSVSAADGILVDPRPEAMAEALTETIPHQLTDPADRLPWGARSWDEVADDLLAQLTLICALESRPFQRQASTQTSTTFRCE